MTSYTRWLEAVVVKGRENQEVYVTFSRGSSAFGWNRKSAFQSMFPKNRPISDCEAGTLFGCTVGHKSTSRRGLNAFHWRNSAGCSALSRSRMRMEMSFTKRLCPSERTSARESTGCRDCEINARTDWKIKLVSIERSKRRRVVALTFTIKTQPKTKGARN